MHAHEPSFAPPLLLAGPPSRWAPHGLVRHAYDAGCLRRAVGSSDADASWHVVRLDASHAQIAVAPKCQAPPLPRTKQLVLVACDAHVWLESYAQLRKASGLRGLDELGLRVLSPASEGAVLVAFAVLAELPRGSKQDVLEEAALAIAHLHEAEPEDVGWLQPPGASPLLAVCRRRSSAWLLNSPAAQAGARKPAANVKLYQPAGERRIVYAVAAKNLTALSDLYFAYGSGSSLHVEAREEAAERQRAAPQVTSPRERKHQRQARTAAANEVNAQRHQAKREATAVPSEEGASALVTSEAEGQARVVVCRPRRA